MYNIEWRKPIATAAGKQEIDLVQERLGVIFPKTYLELLQIGDGLVPDDQGLYSVDENGKYVEGNGISNFLPIKGNEICECHETLLDDAVNYGYDLTQLKWVIPIADDADGWICLDYRDDPQRKKCKISCYDITKYTNDPYLDEDYGVLHIADSFEKLLEMLARRGPKRKPLLSPEIMAMAASDE